MVDSNSRSANDVWTFDVTVLKIKDVSRLIKLVPVTRTGRRLGTGCADLAGRDGDGCVPLGHTGPVRGGVGTRKRGR